VFLPISQATCLCGVVQGFVLGLLLFLIRSTVHPDFSHSLNHTYTTHTRCSFYPSDFDSRTLYRPTTVAGVVVGHARWRTDRPHRGGTCQLLQCLIELMFVFYGLLLIANRQQPDRISLSPPLKLQALGQCIPPPKHVLPVSRYLSRHLANGFEITNPENNHSVYRRWSGSPPKFNRLFIASLPTFPENFMQIRSGVFAQSC